MFSMVYIFVPISLILIIPCVSSAGSNMNSGVGHGLDINRVSESKIPDHIKSNFHLDINGTLSNRRKIIKTHDFTGDGVPDKVVCHIASSTDNGVEVFDGKTGDIWFSWQVPEYSEGGRNRQFRGCAVFDLGNNRSAIAYAGVRTVPNNGLRGNENQWIHFQNDNGGLSLTKVTRVNGKAYVPAARSVKCTTYPEKLVKQGFKSGALCFYAAYDGVTPSGGGTLTALIKIEYNKNKQSLEFKDLTQSSNLPWSGGTNGTLPFKWTNGKSNNLSMLDGVFIDYDRDGLIDLGTGGAHSNSYMFHMVHDQSKLEGFRYEKSMDFGYEYIYRLQAFNETEPKIKSSCIYVSNSYHAFKHYLRCYKSGAWVDKTLDDDIFNAEDSSVNILSDGFGGMYISTMNVNRERFYKLKFKDNEISKSLKLTVEKDQIKITGYVCRKNDDNFQPRIALTSKENSKKNGYHVYQHNKEITSTLNYRQMPKCLSKIKNSATGRIKVFIDKKDLISKSGSIWVHLNGDLGHSVHELKYSY